MSTMQEIQTLTSEFAAVRRQLVDKCAALQAEIDAVRRAVIPTIRELVTDVADARDRLHAAIESAPHLFSRRRTVTINGVRVGYVKQRGTVVIEDEEAVIKRIRSLLPEEQAELLIRVRESVHKPAVYDLTAADLKRLGITVTETEDAVLIKPVDSEVDKIVAALLQEAEKVEGAE